MGSEAGYLAGGTQQSPQGTAELIAHIFQPSLRGLF